MNLPEMNILPALPEFCLLGGSLLILLFDLFSKDSRRALTYVFSLLLLIICAALQYWTYQPYAQTSFSGMFVSDPLAATIKLCMYLTTFLALVYSRKYIEQNQLFRGEFFTLTLFSLLGMNVMVSSNNMLTLYVGLEILSLALYGLIALRRDAKLATEAAIKYFVLGALASGLLLYGISMLYGASGSLFLSNISQMAAAGTLHSKILFSLGVVFIVCGLAFKLGVVPFHFWVPDVYQGSPLAVTLIISAAPKIAGFVFLYRFLVQGLSAEATQWSLMLIILSVLSLAIGNIAAIMQSNIKRMLAYSAIAHMGFVLLGFASTSSAGYSASLFYVLAYVLMALVSFGVLLILSRSGFECENLDDLKGLNSRNSWYALLMMLAMFSLAGIPPLLGFYAKLDIIRALVNANLTWLAVFAVLMSLIGAFYYLRIIKLMYMDEANENSPLNVPRAAAVLLSLNALALLLIGILPQHLLDICVNAIYLTH